MKTKFLLILCILFAVNSYAQISVLDKAKNFVQTYNYQKAITLIDSELTIRNNPDLLFYKGISLKALNKWNVAIKCFTEIYQTDSANLRIITEIADCYKQAGNSAGALRFYRIASALDTSRVFFKLQICSNLFVLGFTEEAKTNYLKIWHQDTTYQYVALQLGRCYESLAKTDTALIYYRKYYLANLTDYVICKKMAELLAEKRKYKESLEVTEEYRSRDSTNRMVNRTNAYTFYLLKNTPEATTRLQTCFNRGDSSTFVCKYLGYFYFIKDQYENANKYLEKAYNLDPNDFLSCYYLGISLVRSAQTQHAIEVLNASDKTFSKYVRYLSSTFQNLSEAHNDLNEFDISLDYLLRAKNLDPNDTIVIYRLGSHYDNNLKNREKAIQYYEEFMTKRPARNENGDQNLRNISFFDVTERRLKFLKAMSKAKKQREN